MASISGIASIEARIAQIQSRLDPMSPSGARGVDRSLSTELGGPDDPTVGFDPFGAAYEQALREAGIVAAVDPTDPAGGAAPITSGAPATVTAPPGDGTVATFSLAEFASIGGGSSPSIGAGADTPGSAASTPVIGPDGRAVDGARASAAPGFADPRTSTALGAYATPSLSPSSSAGAPLSSGTSSSLVDSMVLDGPVYTGAASRAISAYTSAAGAGVAAPASTRYTGDAGVGSSVGKIGGFGPMPVPSELRAHGNGQLPVGALQRIGQGGHRLYAPAAEAWQSAVSAARADGIELTVTDTYRSYEQQVDLAARKGLYADGGYAAVPGTSNHGWGLALDADLDDPTALAWMRANAFRFGFVEAVPREPWHWEFRPEQA